MASGVDPYQMVSSEAIWSGSKQLARLDKSWFTATQLAKLDKSWFTATQLARLDKSSFKATQLARLDKSSFKATQLARLDKSSFRKTWTHSHTACKAGQILGRHGMTAIIFTLFCWWVPTVGSHRQWRLSNYTKRADSPDMSLVECLMMDLLETGLPAGLCYHALLVQLDQLPSVVCKNFNLFVVGLVICTSELEYLSEHLVISQ